MRVAQLVIIMISIPAYAQEIMLDSKFDNAVEISSLIFQGRNLLLVSEKCKEICYLNNQGNIIKCVSIDSGYIKGKEIEIEGASVYGNGVLMTNEKIGEVLFLDDKTGIVHKVETDIDLSMDVGLRGMEGITVDTARGLCYILKEKDRESESTLRIFKIVNNGDAPRLQFLKNIRLILPDNSWRLSDLYYNSIDHQIFFLKTKKGKYEITRIEAIMAINTESEGMLTPTLFLSLSDKINRFNERGFNTNLEGITINNNFFYVVSDNSTRSLANCSTTGDGKTLLLKLSAEF